MIDRRVQAALTRSDTEWTRRNDAYMQEVRGQMHMQDQRMASLESQSFSNAGECFLFVVKPTINFPMNYMMIYYCYIFDYTILPVVFLIGLRIHIFWI